MTSLKHNLLANYTSQIYVTAVGILMVPMYIEYMGAEAYGLVGFFAMLQAWFNLLDMGLTPTTSRESARFHGGAISVLEYRRLARALEGLFGLIALAGGVLLFVLAEPIAKHWLNAQHLPVDETLASLRLMALIVALRWMSGFYRGIITGAERLVWLSGMNSAVATGRFVLVLPLLMFISTGTWVFFAFQLLVAVLELLGLAIQSYRLLPAIPVGQRIQWEWAPIKPVLKFSMSIAFTSSVWVLVTQSDKLVLSKLLPLADYGYFTVAVLLASGITIVSGPISGALLPRMARLQAEGEHEQLITLYRQATQMVMVIAVPSTLILAMFSKSVLWTWTGNAEVVNRAALTLTLYSVGNGFLSISAFLYYLQYSKGDLRMHLLGNILFLFIFLPCLIFNTNASGVNGAGWTWMISNAIYFLVWSFVVHARIIPGRHKIWMRTDVLRIFIPTLIAGLMIKYFVNFENIDRLQSAFKLFFIFGFLLLISFLAKMYMRKVAKFE